MDYRSLCDWLDRWILYDAFILTNFSELVMLFELANKYWFLFPVQQNALGCARRQIQTNSSNRTNQYKIHLANQVKVSQWSEGLQKNPSHLLGSTDARHSDNQGIDIAIMVDANSNDTLSDGEGFARSPNCSLNCTFCWTTQHQARLGTPPNIGQLAVWTHDYGLVSVSLKNGQKTIYKYII